MVRRIFAVTVLVAAMGVVAPPTQAASSCGGRGVTIQGGSGNNTINGTSHADVIDAGAGDDVVNGRGGDDVICGGEGSDDLRGNAGNDRLYGGVDRVREEKVYGDMCVTMTPTGYCLVVYYYGDVLRGNTGNDQLVPGYDNRTFDTTVVGVSRIRDQLRWDTAPRAVTVNLTNGTATGEGGDSITAAGLLRTVTSPYADTVVGTTGDDEIQTGSGADTVFARDGEDSVWTGSSSTSTPDEAHGGPGDDQLTGANGPDHLFGDEGADTLFDNSTIGADQMFGGPDSDDLSDVIVDLAGQVADGGGDANDTFKPDLRIGGVATWDMVTGSLSFTNPSRTMSAPGFHLLAPVRDNTTGWDITGTDQSDTVHAHGTFRGAGANDHYFGGSGPDTYNGGTGSDSYENDSGGTDTCISVEVDPSAFCNTSTP